MEIAHYQFYALVILKKWIPLSMSIEVWIWLIIIVISLIARAGRKKKGAATREAANVPDAHDPDAKPLTFEDLLREIQQSKKKPEPKPTISKPRPLIESRKPFVQETKQKQDYIDYDDDIKEEEQTFKDTSLDYQNQGKTYETYEKAKQEAFLRPTLEETSRVEDTDIRWRRFDEFAEHKEKVNFKFINQLRDPDGFKKAFILSEVLKRKY